MEIYTQFSQMKDFLLPVDVVARMYRRFRAGFPQTHAVMATIVSTSRERVELANQFADYSNEADGSINLDSDSSHNGSSDESRLSLQKRERAILEYFMALIRLKSQKRLRYWSMVTPLAYFSQGFRLPRKSSASGLPHCNLAAAWSHCNGLFDESLPNREGMICQQMYLSGAFNNW